MVEFEVEAVWRETAWVVGEEEFWADEGDLGGTSELWRGRRWNAGRSDTVSSDEGGHDAATAHENDQSACDLPQGSIYYSPLQRRTVY